ncbi:MAG: ABC transporter permease [Actinomycetota bacterium]|nr:ABC transporter permease [Actinomycetota bacterium]
MKAAVLVEALKLRRSLVGVIATIAVVGGTIALLGGITAALASGNPEVIAKAGPGAALDWTGLLSSATQITAAGGLLGFGVVLAWLFAREFTDGTIAGLFALPVGRGRIAIAKLIVYSIWVITVSITLTGCLAVLGLILGYGFPNADAWAGLGRQFVLVVLTGAVATPTAWVATVTRSILAGVGCTIGLVVIAQVSVLAGAGGWMPLAAPALWAMSHGAGVTVGQLTLSLVLAMVFATLTLVSWDRLQMNR